MEYRRLLVVALTLLMPSAVQAQQRMHVRNLDRKKQVLPPQVRTALWGLPERTESLIVTKGQSRSPVESPDFHRFCFEGNVSMLKAALPKSRFDTLIESERIEYTVSGDARFSDRGFQIPGEATFVSCEMVYFARKVAGRVLNALLESDGSQWKVKREGRLVEVDDRKNEYRAYFAKMDDKTLVAANNRAWLETTMLRAKARPASRSFPSDLPQWRYVDTDAPIWGLRHYRRESAKTSITSMLRRDPTAQGLVFSYDPKRQHVVLRYVSTGSKPNRRFAELWTDIIDDRVALRMVDEHAVQVDIRVADDPDDAETRQLEYTPVEASVTVHSLMGYTAYP